MICTEERGFIWDQSELKPFVRQDSECICEQIHVSVLAFFFLVLSRDRGGQTFEGMKPTCGDVRLQGSRGQRSQA